MITANSFCSAENSLQELLKTVLLRLHSSQTVYPLALA